MTISHFRAARIRRNVTALSIAACLIFLAIGATDAAASQAGSSHSQVRSSHVVATSTRVVPHALAVAARRSTKADRILVTKAKDLKRCLAAHHTRPSRCKAARRAVQQAGRKLKIAERKLSKTARRTPSARGAADYAALQAPRITVAGKTLTWTRVVAGISSYLLVRKVPGQVDQYSMVIGTSTTPPPVPGLTVKYSVRTAVSGSAWGVEQSIAYPKPADTLDTQAAPAITVSGQTLSWVSVGHISTYVLASKVAGHVDQFTEVNGTSITPTPVPGTVVHYSLRTAVNGSAWSPEVAIAYPAESTPPTPTEPEKTPPRSPSTSPMWVGMDAGGWPSSFAADVAGAASYVRLDSPSSIAGWTAAGVKVIDDMSGPYNSGGVSAVDATEWAAKAVAFYKANPALAAIEVLNEPGNKWIGWGSNAGSTANAAAYDHLLKVVHEAFVANFGSSYPNILASYDGGEGPTTWGEEMWAADPNVGSYIDGITMHAYGGTSNRTPVGSRDHIEAAHAQHPDIPIYVTEVGWPTAVGQPATGDSLQWTEAEQAQNITNFINWAKGTGYIADVTIFNYRDYGANDWYGIESASGAHKLSYAALAAFRH